MALTNMMRHLIKKSRMGSLPETTLAGISGITLAIMYVIAVELALTFF